jgi:hypothetical protein
MRGQTSRPSEMLRLAIIVGEVIRMAKAPFHEAWVIQARLNGWFEYTFSERTGDCLSRLGLIALHPDPTKHEVRSRAALLGWRYVPTTAGVAAIRSTREAGVRLRKTPQ